MLAGLFAATTICLPLWGAEPEAAQPADETASPPAIAAEGAAPPSPTLKTLVLGSAEPYMAIGGSQGRLLPREKLDPVLDAVKNNGPGTIVYFAARFLDAQ
jgi:hypothetical protein